MDVAIAGGGPTGLMLACELRLAGVDVAVFERLAGPSGESRAGGLHPRSLEVLDQRGMLEPFLAAGRRLPGAHFAGLPLDFSDLPTRYPFLLVLLQRHIERLLEERARALDVPIHREREVVGFAQDADRVALTLDSGATVTAGYLVGCDGGRSTVRRSAGIGFPGTGPTVTALLGDVELTDPPAQAMLQQRHEHGDVSVLAFEPGWHRVMTTEYDRIVDRDTPVGPEELRATLIRLCGTDYGMHSPRWISRYNDAARQADAYRDGRVLLAGDAAHIHYPAGGQGLNTGLQDAVNLGWKLAAVLAGRAGPGLLDTYFEERHPVAARVLHNTRAQVALSRTGPQVTALREVIGSLMDVEEVNRRLALMVTGLDVRYPTGGEHPVLGLRVPDLELSTGRLYRHLSGMNAVLLDLSGADRRWATPPGVEVVHARGTEATWRVPVAGTVPAPEAVLIRPDGYLAWVSDQGTGALRTVLARVTGSSVG